MKIVSFLAVLFCGPFAGLASDTAYQALRAVGIQRGQEILNHVLEVQGRNGAPRPASWKILLDDPAARGGVRELEVVDGKVTAERTPIGATTAAGGAMDFQKLNLDSEGAFKIAEKEASKAHLGFDQIDFTLRSGEAGRPPVWILQLTDTAHHVVGTMNLSADSGAVVRSDLYGSQRAPVVSEAPEERVPVDREPDRVVVHDEPAPAESEDDYVNDANGHRLRVGHRINKALHEAGATLEEFFTGQRTIDRKYRDEN